MSEICWLGEQECHDVAHVGAKAANISRIAARYNVPAGFALSVESFDRWADVPASGNAKLRGDPEEFRRQIMTAYRRLGEAVSEERPPVAVRSSATDEDSSGASFAGQHDTYLNIRGEEEVAAAIVRCWGSLRNDEAVAYRDSAGLGHDGARMAVLVQHLVPADSSGVVFSANPVTGSRDEVMLNTNWGLGETVVSGMVTPDTFIVSKSGFTITSKAISEKALMTIATADGTKEVNVPRSMRSAPSVSPEQVGEVARLAVSLEESLGWPVDAEFAIRGPDLFLLQARPITTL